MNAEVKALLENHSMAALQHAWELATKQIIELREQGQTWIDYKELAQIRYWLACAMVEKAYA